MRKLTLTFTLIIFLCIVINGCSNLNKQFVGSVDGYTQVILPEYEEYVENDPNLIEDTKRIRIQTANEFQALVDEAKEEQK